MVELVWLEAVVGAKGQVVVPKPLRDAAGVHPGDHLLCGLADGQIILRKSDPAKWVEEFLAIAPKRKEPKHIDWHRDDDDYYG